MNEFDVSDARNCTENLNEIVNDKENNTHVQTPSNRSLRALGAIFSS